MLRLNSITIRRFRGIQSGAVETFADVNLLIGRNNSGKSTVAEGVMRTLAYWVKGEGADPIGRKPISLWEQIRKNPGPPAPEGWYKQDQSKPIALSASVGQFKFEWSCTVPGSIERNEQPSDALGANKSLRQFCRFASMFRPLDGTNQEIENKLWPQMLSTRRDKALTRALNDIFGMTVEQLQVLPDSRLLLLFSDFSLPLDVQGDGARSALRCLMMLTSLQGTLFVIEEPECHQHPGSLERFAAAVCRLAKEQSVQLLISTHSAECVRSFLKGSQDAGSESAVFHLELDEGNLSATRLSPEAVETLQGTGLDVRYLDLYA